MPPWRTTLDIRAASMPNSRATMASASSEVWRCWVSKSAGTYSASITGVIGSTFKRRTAPLQVCDSVAAVAIAGLARSVSARSIGTRMELNICASPVSILTRIAALVVGRLLQQLWTDELHQLPATECHVVPVIGLEVEDDQPRGRQIVQQRLARGLVAAAGERECHLVHSGIVADQQQPFRIGCRRHADAQQQLRRLGAVKFRHQLDLGLRCL